MLKIYSSGKIEIRQFNSNDGEQFCRFFDDEEVTRYLPKLTKQEYLRLFTDSLQDYQNGFFGRWGIFDVKNDAFIGNCLLRLLEEDPEKLEIGYSIKTAYWGKGIGSEIALALVNYAFKNTAYITVSALTEIDNLGSQKVLLKTGFERQDNILRRDHELAFFTISKPAFGIVL